MPYPSLEQLAELLCRDVPGRPQLKELYRRVASGERHPDHLPANTVRLACQAMVILFDYVDRTPPPSPPPAA